MVLHLADNEELGALVSRGKEPKLPLTCRVERGAIRISIDAATVKFATENHPEFWDCEADTYRYKVADSAEWLKSVARYITHEREDGSSLLTDLFDKAIYEAVEQGEEGLQYDD